jgi:hypothetical protein
MTIIKEIDDANFTMAQRELSACLHFAVCVRGELQMRSRLDRQIRQAVACPRGRSLPCVGGKTDCAAPQPSVVGGAGVPRWKDRRSLVSSPCLPHWSKARASSKQLGSLIAVGPDCPSPPGHWLQRQRSPGHNRDPAEEALECLVLGGNSTSHHGRRFMQAPIDPTSPVVSVCDILLRIVQLPPCRWPAMERESARIARIAVAVSDLQLLPIAARRPTPTKQLS